MEQHMFNGIIQKISSITTVEPHNGFAVHIARPDGWTITMGESIAINGICSTVCEYDDEKFCVEYMPETLAKTTVNDFRKNTKINLEKSLHAGDPIDGHFVQGHVDCVAIVSRIVHKGESIVVSIGVEKSIASLIAPKGSIALDGVSLTVVDASDDQFSVALVGYTQQHTILGNLQEGDRVNVETDMMAKYVARYLESKSTHDYIM